MSKTDGIGVWLWNETLPEFVSGGQDPFEFNFTCNGENYIALGSGDGAQIDYISNLDNGTPFVPPWDAVWVYSFGGGWEDNSYRTIDIKTSPSTEFIEILNTNATYRGESGGGE